MVSIGAQCLIATPPGCRQVRSIRQRLIQARCCAVHSQRSAYYLEQTTRAEPSHVRDGQFEGVIGVTILFVQWPCDDGVDVFDLVARLFGDGAHD